LQSVGYAHVYDPTWPPIAAYWTSTTPYANVTSVIDKIKASGGAGAIVLHKLVAASPVNEDVLITDFQAALDYITTIGGIDIVPASQLWTY
jgi:hypothetical protein